MSAGHEETLHQLAPAELEQLGVDTAIEEIRQSMRELIDRLSREHQQQAIYRMAAEIGDLATRYLNNVLLSGGYGLPETEAQQIMASRYGLNHFASQAEKEVKRHQPGHGHEPID